MSGADVKVERREDYFAVSADVSVRAECSGVSSSLVCAEISK